MLSTRRFLLPVGLAALLLGVTGACTPFEEEVELTGVSAYKVARKDRARAPSTDIESVMVMLEEEEERQDGASPNVEPAPSRSTLMQSTARGKVRIDPQGFDRPEKEWFLKAKADESGKRSKADGVDLGGLEAEYYIPRVEDIPVRNQGQRGTCAAFAGVGHLEYLALKQHPALGTFDLSEQRFYYMSKPECHSSGCTVDVEGGSWYGTGFDASIDGAAPPGDNVPLEADCPYNPNPGSNELQLPQLPSCSRGAVKVRAVDTVTYPQELVDALHRHKLPILWASPLSDNWFENRGLITASAAGDPEASMHAGGHAYLIVGYRKLPDKPEEGGMCFIVKNSWGTGWGVNGYSCQTLKWMQDWRFRDGSTPVWLEHPVVTGLTVRDDLQGGDLPDNDDAEDDSPPDIPDDEEEGDGDLGPLPDPDPSPDVDWAPVALYGPNDSYYRAEYGRSSDGVVVRLELQSETGVSNALGLYYGDGTDHLLEYDGDIVGALRTAEDDMLLCSHKYSMVCSLRLDPNTNRLYIEWPYPSNRRVKDGEIPDGSWADLIPEGLFGAYAVQVNRPADWLDWLGQPGYIRMERPDGSRTEEMRVGTNEEGKVRVMNVSVGDLLQAELCSGGYGDRCRFLSEGVRMFVLPGW